MTKAQNGHQIEVGRNQEFEIALPETRTAGYHWTIVSKGEPACELLAEDAPRNTANLGGSGLHRWRFRAASAGAGKLEFHYARSWENSAGAAKTFILKVLVQP